jgi:aspartate-semialdehyde dehydrogenase
LCRRWNAYPQLVKLAESARESEPFALALAEQGCWKVPVYRSHALAVHAEFRSPVSIDRARDAIAKFPG